MIYLKIIAGGLLLLAAAGLLVYAVTFRYSHPWMTETELFNEVGWIGPLAFIPGVGGLILVAGAMDDYNDE